jgi:hypothetical protein
MDWNRALPGPEIKLRDGRAITTLADARDLIGQLPEFHEGSAHWREAFELLGRAAENLGWLIDALRQLWRALKADGLV